MAGDSGDFEIEERRTREKVQDWKIKVHDEKGELKFSLEERGKAEMLSSGQNGFRFKSDEGEQIHVFPPDARISMISKPLPEPRGGADF